MRLIERIPEMFRGQADGAIPNGSRIEKSCSEDKDLHQAGELGTVISSTAVSKSIDDQVVADGGMTSGGFLYFVEFDAKPGMPVAIMASKVKRHEPS